MRFALLADFGSTCTKLTAVDLAGPRLLATARAATTVETDIHAGFEAALEQIGAKIGRNVSFDLRLACSSAAGGLRMVAVGLVPELTAEAARRAALGAGARVEGVYAYTLGPADLWEIARLKPEIILLAGGTDGGNRRAILENTERLAASSIECPVVVAGNREVREEAARILERGGQPVHLAENVLPRLGQIEAADASRAVRQVFLERIVAAKGLDRLADVLDGVVLPTPAAVLAGLRLLADGTRSEPGWREGMVVDVGGATTDVHTVAEGRSGRGDVLVKGPKEPRVGRTVEGDLGLRSSAPSLLSACDADALAAELDISRAELERMTERLSRQPVRVPAGDRERRLDALLAREAVRLATRRHAGYLEPLPTPLGLKQVQRGKDLTGLGYVIGVGGIFQHYSRPREILGAARHEVEHPERLKPREPSFYVDSSYILAAMGLLAEKAPDAALKILKQSLTPLGEEPARAGEA